MWAEKLQGKQGANLRHDSSGSGQPSKMPGSSTCCLTCFGAFAAESGCHLPSFGRSLSRCSAPRSPANHIARLSQATAQDIITAKPGNFSHSITISPISQPFSASRAAQRLPSLPSVSLSQVRAAIAQPVPAAPPRVARDQLALTPVPAPRTRATVTQSTSTPIPVFQVGVTVAQPPPVAFLAPRVRAARIPPDPPRGSAETLQLVPSCSGGSEQLACPPANPTPLPSPDPAFHALPPSLVPSACLQPEVPAPADPAAAAPSPLATSPPAPTPSSEAAPPSPAAAPCRHAAAPPSPLAPMLSPAAAPPSAQTPSPAAAPPPAPTPSSAARRLQLVAGLVSLRTCSVAATAFGMAGFWTCSDAATSFCVACLWTC